MKARDDEDMSYDQIAAYLDVPPSTVRGRLHIAKQALKEALQVLGSDILWI
jgi:DNA-directed RNA polymerase specialized sigma24 family protein